MEIQEFFEGMLPALIARRGELFDSSDKRVCLMVHGVGAWTLQFGDHTAADALQPGIDFDADLVATWSEEGFVALLEGEADHEGLVPVAMGDTSLLSKIGNLMLPPAKGGLGARLMGF